METVIEKLIKKFPTLAHGFGASRVILNAAREFAEIEHLFACHGGDRDILEKKAKELANTTCMTFKQAVRHVLCEDMLVRSKLVGLFSCKEINQTTDDIKKDKLCIEL